MSSQSFETIMTTAQQHYEQIAAMTYDTYNRNVVIQSFSIINELNNFPRAQMRQVLTVVYKILSTTAGRIFMISSKNFTTAVVLKAKEFMDNIPNPVNDTALELARAISKFSRVNEGVFLGHGISYTLYNGYGEDDGENDCEDDGEDEEDDDEEDGEDEEDDDEEDGEEEGDEDEDEEYDMAAYEEYEYDENQEEEDAIEERQRQFWKNRMTLVLDHLLRRNDPFYQAAISCIKQQNEKVQEDKERQRFFRDILRRELETGNEIVDSHYFKTDYKLVEMFTRKKVVDEDSKKFGCSVCVKFGWSAANVMIFDGTYTYEYEIIIDTQILIEELKEEIRQDTKQCLYDTRLVCKDIAGLISSYMC
jgi:hypothetical protein